MLPAELSLAAIALLWVATIAYWLKAAHQAHEWAPIKVCLLVVALAAVLHLLEWSALVAHHAVGGRLRTVPDNVLHAVGIAAMVALVLAIGLRGYRHRVARVVAQ